MPRKLRDVWAVACPKCHVAASWPCLDLRGHGTLFGRRTHRERAKAVRERVVVRDTNRIIYDPQWTTTTTGGTTMAWYDARQAQTWYRWTATTGTAATYAITDEQRVVWDGWTNQAYQAEQFRIARAEVLADAEQRTRELENRRALAAARNAERAELRIVAEARAQELLRMILTPEQVKEMERDLQVTLQAPSGRRYRVLMSTGSVHGNIKEIDGHGCPLQTGCVAPEMYEAGGYSLPLADGWVGQILAILHNEEELRAKTNWSFRQQCRQPNVPILGVAA